MPKRSTTPLALAIGTFFVGASSAPVPPPEVTLNDNLRPAGRVAEGVLTLHLEVQRGTWHLLGAGQPGGAVYAFAERDRAPEIPGPLIRVPLGTEIRVTIRNPFDSTLVVHGLTSRRTGFLDTVRVAARTTREVRFTADTEGTYFYWAAYGDVPLEDRHFDDSQLNGALVVDAPGAVPDDRILLLSMWFAERNEDGSPHGASEFFAINGRPWPHTERLTYDLGDSIRWRIINASESGHPMHLHGFYFRVDARGDLARDTLYWPNQRRMAVTEAMASGSSMSMVWSPDRPGGWIFHCHISWHVTANPAMEPNRPTPSEWYLPMFAAAHLDHDPDRHVVEGMGGLMVGIYVRPPAAWAPDEPKRRELRLFIQAAPADSTLTGRAFSYVLQEGLTPPAPDSITVPSSTLVLRRGEPTSIWVFNRAGEPSQIHWHGLEIESYFDGVTGFGGYPTRRTPAIAPGDSFEMRITPPRAGSFMYHTHLSDLRQQSAGLYGAFVVLEPDEVWNPTTDRVLLLGYLPSAPGNLGQVAINGSVTPDTVEFEAGTAYRLRFMNITLDRGGTHVRLVRNGHPVLWLPLAKDGFDLPAHQRRPAFADTPVVVGETADFRYTPRAGGELTIEVRSGGGGLLAAQEVRVRDAGGR